MSDHPHHHYPLKQDEMPMEFEGYHQVVVSISWEQDEQPNPPLLEDNCNANSLVLESDN